MSLGSPPPMRGKASGSFGDYAKFRITPAYAGKSSGTEWGFRTDWDHPRLCGEKQNLRLFVLYHRGSPPPMRGKVPKSLTCQIANRITPAYAGKRNHWQKKTLLQKDHPRLCGEKFFLPDKSGTFAGSPPPMRGKASGSFGDCAKFRITPAYAGKSSRICVLFSTL